MKKVVTIICVILITVIFSACTERTNDHWGTQVAGHPGTSDNLEQNDDIDQITDDLACDYDGLDMQAVEALQKKIDNKEELTQQDIDLYVQAEEKGYEFKKPSGKSGVDDNKTGVDEFTEHDLKQWKDAFGEDIPVIGEGKITSTQNVQSDSKTIAARVKIDNVDLETAKDYLENFKNNTWHELDELHAEKTNTQAFGDILEDRTGAAMESASLSIDEEDSNAYYQAAYFSNNEKYICEVLIKEDASKAGVFSVTVTILDGRQL